MQKSIPDKNFIRSISKNETGKFGLKIYFLLVENFSDTYLVGGAVRDLLLGKNITDIDIATTATPQEVTSILKDHFIELNTGFQNFGVIVALEGKNHVAIATTRKDLPADTRYPEVAFTKSLEVDSKRRDFTVNALYLGLKSNKIQDFHKGLLDLKKKTLRFIGTPTKRIKEDPLRIIRALRFSLVYNFKIAKESYAAIKKNFNERKNISKSRLETELAKIEKEKFRKIILEVINTPDVLDKYFKKP